MPNTCADKAQSKRYASACDARNGMQASSEQRIARSILHMYMRWTTVYFRSQIDCDLCVTIESGRVRSRMQRTNKCALRMCAHTHTHTLGQFN